MTLTSAPPNQTLSECLDVIATLMAPIAPFFAEWLYRALNQATGRHAQPSVHLRAYPDPDPALIDAGLERRMEIARDLVSTALLLRNQAGINVRRPLARLQLVVPPTVATTDVEQVRALVLEELNVRALQLQDTPGELVRYAVRPNFRKLGPVLGRNMQALARQLSDLDDVDVHRFMDVGTLTVSLDGADFELKRADLEVQVRPQRQDLHVARTAQGIVVALDTRIDDELLASGLARESSTASRTCASATPSN